MNLGQAVTVCLYELARDPKAAAKFTRALKKAAPATAGEIERFTAILTEALSASGFLEPSHRSRRRRPHPPPRPPPESPYPRRRHVDRHNAPNRLEAERH